MNRDHMTRSWHQAEVECAYKRGYSAGIMSALQGFTKVQAASVSSSAPGWVLYNWPKAA